MIIKIPFISNHPVVLRSPRNDACGHRKVVGTSPCESKLGLGKRCPGAWGSPMNWWFL